MSDFESIYPCGSQPGKLYGLCKVHKRDLPFRPVVSMINTAEYKLAKFLDTIIKPHLPTKYMLNSTAGFLEKLKQFWFKPSDILVSFDVVSLFTNVPLNETIHIIADKVYKTKEKPKFEKEVFIKLMEMATSGIFMYGEKYFKQTDGVTMGSPLGPTMANFCLSHFENQLLEECDDTNGPSLYARYVDDIFCVFRSGIPYESFLNKLNALHPNLKFTMELGNSSLAFLDTYISLPTDDNGTFSSRIFRKATHTGLILNFESICPQKWKVGLIQCLIHRAYCISSSWKAFSDEIEILRNMFIKNGYPERIFWSCVKRFTNNKFSSKPVTTVKEDRIEAMFSIPYIGLPSVIFGRKVRESFRKLYGIDIKVIYTSFKVKNYFSLKCHTPLPLLANVVYKFQCLRDVDKVYIGKTRRHLATRVKEHGHSSSSSAIRDHLFSCPTCQSEYSSSSFRVIDTARNDFEVTIKEALHIKNSKPALNRQLFNSGSSFVLNIF